MAQDYRDLMVWQKAIELSVCIYQLTRSFPRSELYELTSQIRRASVSIASNIAEGRSRLGHAGFRQFLGLAQSSLYELQTQLHIANKLGLLTCEGFRKADSLTNEVSKMLASFIQTLSVNLIPKKLLARS